MSLYQIQSNDAIIYKNINNQTIIRELYIKIK